MKQGHIAELGRKEFYDNHLEDVEEYLMDVGMEGGIMISLPGFPEDRTIIFVTNKD